MNHRVEPPEKKKRKKKTKNPSPRLSPPSLCPSFSLFPEEIAVNCLARISRAYYPTLSIVSKSFRSLVSSTELYAARSHLGSTEQCLYVCLWDYSYQFPQWFTLSINPNQTLPNSTIRKKKKKTTGQLLVPITSSNFASVSKSIVAVGSEIYVIGGPLVEAPSSDVRFLSFRSHNYRGSTVDGAPSSAVRVLDCRSHTWRDAPSMNVARKKALTCACDGKIYVMGGCEGLDDESWAEVFDTKTQTWELLPDPGTEIRKCDIDKITAFEGKIHIWDINKMYAYDPKQGKWECRKGLRTTVWNLECMMDNVSYRYGRYECRYGRSYGCWWYDIKDGAWKEVKGLDSLGEKYKMNGGAIGHKAKVVSCGGKLLVSWKGYSCDHSNKMKIWCAEISLEKCYEGEIWGNVEWVDVVHTVPPSCRLLQCLAVSV